MEDKHFLVSCSFTELRFKFDELVDNLLISLYLGKSLRSTESSVFHHGYKM